ncbi:STAS domain-containing protein [Kitasatospora sp. NPDC093679]|uniref:STAS domain-containing protein n=1 Tax=Kitasatospora sp. NPDC093679 TaxID=3154983 RepID=UPI00343C55EC
MAAYDGLAQRAGPVPDIMIRTAPAGGAVVCALAGMLHAENREQVRQALDAAIGRHPALLAVDLSAVRMFTSSAVNVLLGARRTARAAGLPLVLIAPCTCVRRTLAIAGTDGLFPTFPHLEQALRRRGPSAP